MLRVIFVIFITIHALIHLLGFSKAFGFAELEQLSLEISKFRGIWWLIAGILIVSAALLFFFRQAWWWIPGIIGALLSQILIFMYWSDARVGTLPNLLLVLIAVLGFGAWEFKQSVRSRLDGFWMADPIQAEKISTSELQGLPVPVQKWLIRSGVPGKESAKKVYVQQRGQMRTAPGGKWMQFTAEQWFRTEEPGLLWYAKVGAGSPVRLNGRDQLIDGHGQMLIKLFGLIPIVDAKGPKIDQGTLLRYLAEIIWFPSAALEPYISWESMDTLQARATLTCRGNTVNGVFSFNEEGDVVSFEALRYYDQKKGSSLEVWHIDMDENSYREFNGFRIPTKSEVSWKLAEGDFLWLKLEITDQDTNNVGLSMPK